MGRKVSTGIVPAGFGNVNFEGNVLTTVNDNENLVINPNGTGQLEVSATITQTSGSHVIQNGNMQINAQGDLRLYDSDDTQYVALQAPTNITTNYTLTFPAAVSGTANYALLTDTSGNLSWGSAGPTISNDTSTNSAHYPLFTTTTNAVITSAKVSSTKFAFNPSTGVVSLGGNATATNTTTGTLVVTGGVGISGAVYTGGALSVTGAITATGDITAFQTSDVRLKTNIRPIENALAKIFLLNGVEYDWNDEFIESRDGEDGYFVRKKDVGLIAQELEAVLPEAVAQRQDGYKGVRYDKTVSLLVEAIKELSREVESLKKGE